MNYQEIQEMLYTVNVQEISQLTSANHFKIMTEVPVAPKDLLPWPLLNILGWAVVAFSSNSTSILTHLAAHHPSLPAIPSIQVVEVVVHVPCLLVRGFLWIAPLVLLHKVVHTIATLLVDGVLDLNGLTNCKEDGEFHGFSAVVYSIVTKNIKKIWIQDVWRCKLGSQAENDMFSSLSHVQYRDHKSNSACVSTWPTLHNDNLTTQWYEIHISRQQYKIQGNYDLGADTCDFDVDMTIVLNCSKLQKHPWSVFVSFSFFFIFFAFVFHVILSNKFAKIPCHSFLFFLSSFTYLTYIKYGFP